MGPSQRDGKTPAAGLDRATLRSSLFLCKAAMPTFRIFVEHIGLAVDAAGVLVIVLGLVLALGRYLSVHRRQPQGLQRLRHDMGQGILLGLDILIAADIIRTVAVTPTLESAGVLGLIVLIRTFLSMALQVELEGDWPWRRARERPPQAELVRHGRRERVTVCKSARS